MLKSSQVWSSTFPPCPRNSYREESRYLESSLIRDLLMPPSSGKDWCILPIHWDLLESQVAGSTAYNRWDAAMRQLSPEI
jgi:hypothetical protein